jgi:hypothetical protein
MSTELDRPRGRKRGALLLLLAIALVAGTVAAAELTTSTTLDPPAPQPIALADAGAAYCPVTAGPGDTATLEIASASADEDSEVVLTRYVDGQPVPDPPTTLPAGGSTVLELTAEQAASPVVIDWRGGPVIAQQRLADDAEVAVATCQTQPSDRWLLSGFDTTRGSTSTLYLFNPFGQDAEVSLRFGTPEGPVDLVIADQIAIPAGRLVVTDLAELRPETADLAVTVSATIGRIAAQGQIVRGPAGEGLEAVTGRDLLHAVAESSADLYLPGAVADEVTESWVTVYNPSDRSAALRVQVTTPRSDAAALAGELTVPAGATTRVDLAELSALPQLGVRLESVNAVGLVATRTSAIRDGDRTGVATAVAATATDDMWTIAGARGADAEIVLHNPGTTIVVATVRADGVDPATWADQPVPPNGLLALPVGDLDVRGPALVSADGPLVVGVTSRSPEGPTAFWSATGTSLRAVVGGGEVLPAQRDPGLSSLRATSATETPTALPAAPVPPGEGETGPTPEPTIVPVPSVTPTPSPGLPDPGEPDPAPEATPAPATVDPGPAPPPPPIDPDLPETEQSLFS